MHTGSTPYGMLLKVPALHGKHEVSGPVAVKFREKSRSAPLFAFLHIVILSIPLTKI
jgi:hypothetical protein